MHRSHFARRRRGVFGGGSVSGAGIFRCGAGRTVRFGLRQCERCRDLRVLWRGFCGILFDDRSFLHGRCSPHIRVPLPLSHPLQCLLNDHVADAPELLLPGEWQALGRPLIVVQAHLLVECLPRFIGSGHPLVLRQLLHDGVHDGLDPWRQVAVDLSALDRQQTLC